jgi:hypothetical protein
MFDSSPNRVRVIEDFPAPEGEAKTSITPRRANSIDLP